MDLLLIALLVVNLVISAIALVVAVTRRAAPGAAVGGGNAELRADLSVQRQELAHQLGVAREDRERAERALRQDLAEQSEVSRQSSERLTVSVTEQVGSLRKEVAEQLSSLRQENEAKLEKVRETVDEKLRATLTTALDKNAERIDALSAANTLKQDELQKVLRAEMEQLRQGNEAKLEKMRETVDEKLQSTLERRLGDSFKLVSERLEQVQKGLGEMQTLASDVGGLKRVLTNVKNRGGWGEVQLSRQLEDILTREQYDENVAVKPNTGERVEFAVRLPGRDDAGTSVYLPIDSKFPQEDYERLLDAQEAGDKTAVEEAGIRLERAIVAQAKTIQSKYIDPPHTTDFAILYLPTEGLFAEVIRRPGLASRLQAEQRIIVTGPTTLMSILNSLQMGFRTLAIEQRSSEVWKVLAAAKSEFEKYAQVWEKLGKQLETAQRTVRDAGVRTRAMERKLRGVESLELEVAETAADQDLASLVRDEQRAALQGLERAELDPVLTGLDLGSEHDDEDAAERDSA